MISQELNDMITRIGPGTQAGAVLRHYWQPAALNDEMEDGLPVAVNLMGERLALIREGELLVLATRHCPDDAPSAQYPPSHEIEIDTSGPSYPAHEIKGIVFAYMGPGAPPPFPRSAAT